MITVKRRMIMEDLEGAEESEDREGEEESVKDGVSMSKCRSAVIDSVEDVGLLEESFESSRCGVAVSVEVAEYDDLILVTVGT